VFDRKKENMDEKLTAYCGLCCADCILSCEELFALMDRVDQMLEQLQFDRYEELKSEQYKEIHEVDIHLSDIQNFSGHSSRSSDRTRIISSTSEVLIPKTSARISIAACSSKALGSVRKTAP
jgi:hypothetical protein